MREPTTDGQAAIDAAQQAVSEAQELVAIAAQRFTNANIAYGLAADAYDPDVHGDFAAYISPFAEAISAAGRFLDAANEAASSAQANLQRILSLPDTTVAVQRTRWHEDARRPIEHVSTLTGMYLDQAAGQLWVIEPTVLSALAFSVSTLGRL